MPFGDSAHYAVVSAMITPAFFLTATASLLMVSNARLARVVDRMREDLARLLAAPDTGPLRERLERSVYVHRRRSRLVLMSLRLLYASLSAFVGTSLVIALDSLAGYHFNFLPTALAVLGVLLMFTASVCLGREARYGLRMLEDELDEQLQHKRRRR